MLRKWLFLSIFFAQLTIQAVYKKHKIFHGLSHIESLNPQQTADYLNRITDDGKSTNLHIVLACPQSIHYPHSVIHILNKAHASGSLFLERYDTQARTPLMVVLEKSNSRLAQWFVTHGNKIYASNECFYIWKKALEGYMSSGDITLLTVLDSEQFRLQNFQHHDGKCVRAHVIKKAFIGLVEESEYPSKEAACTIISNAAKQSGFLQALNNFLLG